MEFKGIQRTQSYTQINNGNIEQVFSLLCPVREKDWQDGWNYKMIYSKSGLIEKGCVFSTPNNGVLDTIWQVTQYDNTNYRIEFLRLNPEENVVKINIQLEKISEQLTKAVINYQYTGLNEEQNKFIETGLKKAFTNSMKWLDKALNHYLETGKMLKKDK
ncbi:MAG: hypothetical protein GQ564_17750 [Bacteroidales bacterium]|nr:hypothetical protein [Bacteroidales bacterium]